MSRKWAPAAPPGAPGIWRDINCMLPTKRGNYMTARVWNGVLTTTLASPGTTLNAWAGLLPTGAGVAFVGTTTKLWYTDLSATFTDRSKGGGYTSSATTWHFAQYGIYTLATNNVDQIQVRDSTTTNAFANLGGTPPTTAKILVVQSNAALAFNTNSGGHYWAASDVGNHANWTTGDATSGFIAHRPGPITAAIAFGDEVIVFKAASVYRMRYVGSPVYWTVELIADGIGARDLYSVAVCGNVIVFLSATGPYIFDGSAFRGADVEDVANSVVLADSSSASYSSAMFFPATGSVWFCTSGATITYYAYNLLSDRWGFASPYKTGSTTVLGAYVMLNGSAAAIRNLTSGMAGEDDVYLLDAAAATPIQRSSGNWGGQGSTVEAYVNTGYIGEAGDANLEVSRITPILSAHSLSLNTAVPTAAQMICTPKTYTAMNGAGSSTKTAITSSTDQCRFDTTLNAKAMDFRVGCKVAEFEIEDVVLNAGKRGTS